MSISSFGSLGSGFAFSSSLAGAAGFGFAVGRSSFAGAAGFGFLGRFFVGSLLFSNALGNFSSFTLFGGTLVVDLFGDLDGISEDVGDDTDRLHSFIVGGNGVVDQTGVAVGIDDGDDGNMKTDSFTDSIHFVVDVNNEMNAVREAIRLHIPIVAIVDTNGDPSLVDYPVAANDEAVKSVGIITNIFADAIKIAKEIYNKRAAEEREAAEVAKRVAEEQAANEEPAKEAKPRRTRKAAPADGEAKPRRTRKAAAEGETAPKAPKAADAQ